MTESKRAWITLISAEELAGILGQGDLAIIDARFGLADPTQGERDYRSGHIPGAVYAHLDRDLSDHSRHGHGRHPLPRARDFTNTLGGWGIAPNDQVVVYDARDSAMAAARVWHLLRLLGHKRVAVLDGGFARWKTLGLPTTAEITQRKPTRYSGEFQDSMLVQANELGVPATGQAPLLIDARAAERYRGDVEPIDHVAGHVAGAINHPYALNLQADGRFLSPDELAATYRARLNGVAPDRAVLMCGSGVTACHNLLAMEHAGMHGARLYADSWSGWISDPSRPVATASADRREY
ncbi:MAG: sulfurtransferase [Lysobacteraceae bacterium]